MSDKKVTMPSSMAGLTRFGEEYHSKFQFGPVAIFVFMGAVILLLLLLLTNNGALGNRLLGLA